MQAAIIRRQGLAAGRRQVAVARPVVRMRWQSTASRPTFDQSHLVSGVAGGSAVLLLGYVWYHASGTAKVVSTAKTSIDTFNQAKDKVVQAAPSPSAAMSLLRNVVHSYAAVIPGAGPFIDTTFDQLDKIVSENGEKAQEVLTEAYEEFASLVKDPSKDAGQKITELLAKVGGQLRQLGDKADQDYISPFLESNPQLKKALQGSQDQIQDLINKHGPEAKSLKDDTLKQLTALVGAGLTGDSIAKAIKLVKEKSAEAKNLAESTSADAYKKLAANSEGLLKQMPDLKKLLDDQLPKLAPIIGDKGTEDVKKMYQQLEELGKNAKGKDAKQLAKEAKQIVLENLGKLQQAGANAAGNIKDKLPGGNLIDLGGLPELSEFKTAIEKHGPEASQLAESTYSEIKEVLNKKLNEAKKLGEKAKDDAAKAVKK